MRKNLFFLFIGLLLLSSCNDFSKAINKKTYLIWKYQDPEKILPRNTAIIPGSVQLSLQRDTIIKNLLQYAANNSDTISEKKWIYSSVFFVSKEMLRKYKMYLVLEDIDTYAEVYVNNKIVGFTKDFFLKYTYDITKYLKEGNNSIKLIFKPQQKTTEILYKKCNLGTAQKFIRKPYFMLDHQRGYSYNVVGLQKPAYIITWDKIYISNVHFKTLTLNDTIARIRCSIDLITNDRFKAKFKINTQYGTVFSDKIELRKGEQSINLDFSILHPKLWHPVGNGEQHLYNFNIEIYLNGKPAQKLKVDYGLSNLNVKTTNNQLHVYDGEKELKLYIAQLNPAHNEAGIASYEQLLKSLKSSGFNAVTFWEEGYYPPKKFYETCDKEGILVLQNFFIPNKDFDNCKVLQKNIEKELSQHIKSLSNHVSILAWVKNTDSTKYNKKIFDNILPTLCKDFSPNKPVLNTLDYDNVINFGSEIPSLPERLTLQKIIPDSFDINTPLVSQITFPHENFDILKAIAKKYKAENDPQKLSYFSQIEQAKEIHDKLSKRMFAKKFSAIKIQWLNDYNPMLSPATIDKFGFWKNGQYVYKDLFGDFAIKTTASNNRVVSVINSKSDTGKVLIYYKLYNFEGKLLWQRVENTKLKENFRKEFDLGLFINIFKKDFVVFKTEIYYNEELAKEDYYYFVPENKLNLKDPQLTKKLYKTDNGYLLELTCKYLAHKVKIDANTKDAIIENNYFDILPGETKMISIAIPKNVPDLDKKLQVTTMYEMLK